MRIRGISYGGKCHIPAIPDTPALAVSNLSFRYPTVRGDRPVLDDVSFVVQPGERIALVGPNGAGKSTLIKLILGLEQHRHGTIEVYGNRAHECLHRVAVVPQRSSVDWRFPVSVRQVVMMGRYVHLGWFKGPKARDRAIVESALETMDITALANEQVGELSGGQQQRVMLARALAHDADLLLLDEPLNHVDIRTQELIYHTLEKLTAVGKTVIVSTHDLGVLSDHFTRALFLDGRVIADGPVHEVLTPDTIAEAYGFEFHKDSHRVRLGS